MYQLNLNEQEYKLVEEIICNAFNSLTAKAKLVDLGKMLKESIPVPPELAKEMEDATNDFDKKYEIVSAIHDRIHDLQPVESKNDSIRLHPVPFNNAVQAEDIAKDPEYILNLYGSDKRKLTTVFGLLSSYHTTLNLTMRDDKNHDANSREIKEARDYIWTLIESMK